MLPRKQRRGSSRASWLETGPLAGTGMPGPIHSSSPQFRWEAMRRQREPSARDAAGGTRGTYPQYFRSSPEGCNARGPRDGSAGEWQSDPLRSVRPVAQRPPPCFKEVIPAWPGMHWLPLRWSAIHPAIRDSRRLPRRIHSAAADA